ncbi:MAG: putative Ig domain-containing protein, partial [Pseudomonadota bacterium]
GVRILQNNGAGVLTEVADISTSPASVTGVSVDGDFLYISAGVFSGLLIYDVSDPTNPQFLQQFNTAGDGEAVNARSGVVAMAEGLSGVTTVGCDPSANNQPPVAVGTISDQSDNEGVMIFPLSTNSNFNDPDGQALVYSATGLPPGLDITPGSGVVEGELSFESSGSYPVVITATDPFGLFATQSFTWDIVETNAPPQVDSEIPDQVNNEEDGVNLDVSTHFSDIDGDTLRFEAGNLPEGLTMDGPTGVISGALSVNSGRDETYIVLILAFDPDDAAATQTFEWTVNDTVVVPTIFSDRFEPLDSP